MDLGGWLRSLGLERYEAVFSENEIDLDLLSELTEGDLEKLGLAMGPRKRLLKAIADLSDTRSKIHGRWRARVLRLSTSARGRRAASAVEPTRSENITVTWRRSAVWLPESGIGAAGPVTVASWGLICWGIIGLPVGLLRELRS